MDKFPTNFNELNNLKIRQLKQYLSSNDIDLSSPEYKLCEKSDLIQLILKIQRRKQLNDCTKNTNTPAKYHTDETKSSHNDNNDTLLGDTSKRNHSNNRVTIAIRKRRLELSNKRMKELKVILKNYVKIYVLSNCDYMNFREKKEFIDCIIDIESKYIMNKNKIKINSNSPSKQQYFNDIKETNNTQFKPKTNHIDSNKTINKRKCILNAKRIKELKGILKNYIILYEPSNCDYINFREKKEFIDCIIDIESKYIPDKNSINQPDNNINKSNQPCNNDQEHNSSSPSRSNTKSAILDGKCTHMGCYCTTYSKPTSKWSKGKCKSCNHPKKEHAHKTMTSMSSGDQCKSNIYEPPKNTPSTNTTKNCSFPTSFDELNKLKVRKLKEYLSCKNVNFVNCIEKKDFIQLILKIQKGDYKLPTHNKQCDDFKNDNIISIETLSYQLNINENELCEYITSGMHRLESIFFIYRCDEEKVTELSTLNYIFYGEYKKEISQKNDKWKEEINLLHLFSLMIMTGIKISIIYQLNNKYIDLIDLINKYIQKNKLGSNYFLHHFESQESIKIISGNKYYNKYRNLNIKLLSKNNGLWTIEKRNKFIHKLHECLISTIKLQKYSKGTERDSEEQVIDALKEQNNIGTDSDYKTLLNDFKKYKNALNNYNGYFSSLKNTVNNINILNNKKQKPVVKDFFDALAISAQTVKNSKRNFYPRNCQIAAVLLYHRRKSKYNGRLLQVGTGEGKSIIVYLIASIEVLLNNRKIDVVTSQFLLAKDGCDDQEDLYNKLNISVTYLDPDNSFAYDLRRHKYSKYDVIYGTSDSFMGDMLRIEENLRENRKCEMCIVDEVDNAFIDTILQSMLLSSPTAGMKEFNLIFMTIWVQLKQSIQGLGDPIVFPNGQLFFLMKNAKFIDILSKQLNEIPIKNCKTTIDKIIAFIIFKLSQTKLIYNKQFQHQYGINNINDIYKLELILKTLITNKKNIHKFLSLLSNKNILNKQCKISLYELTKKNMVKFKARFEDGKQFNDITADINDCDFVLLKTMNNNILVLHSIKDQNIEQTVKRQITKFTLKKIGVRYDDNCHEEKLDANNDNKYLENVTENNNLIPAFLKNVVKESCKKWVDSAWNALLNYKLNRNYIIDNNEIKCIDLATGTVQQNMVYSDGLHQFIQLKHDLRMNNMGLSAIIMTKCYFFKQYATNGIITGLTGTLGGKVEHEFYKNMFNVDTINIPTFAEKPLTRYNDILCSNTQEWLDLIALNCYTHLKLKKSVLIVAEDIDWCIEIEKHLKNWSKYRLYEKYRQNVSRYSRDDTSEKLIIKQKMKSGDIIIATNLAGRGTDIKLNDNIINYGGLHVIISFEPENERILKQNIGRTCRAGASGSGIIIINSESCRYCVGNNNSVESVKLIRELISKNEMNALEQRVISESKREAYYTKFIALIDEFENIYWHKRGDYTRHSKSCCKRFSSKKRILSDTVKKQIEYKWSLIYPKIKCDTSSDVNKSDILWNNFKDEIKYDLKTLKHRICYNPFYLNRCALLGDLYNNLNTSQRIKLLEKSRKKLDDAIFTGISWYLKAYIILEHAGEKPDQCDRREASKCFGIAIQYFQSLQERCKLWKSLYSTVKQINGVKNNTTDLDNIIEFEMAEYWTAMIDSCQECLRNINHKKIDVRLRSITKYFECKKCIVYKRVLNNYSQCGLSHIIIIDKVPPGFWERVGAAFTAVLGIAQIVAGFILVSCTGGVLYSLGQHCIERGVAKAVAGIKGLFSDDWDTAEFWKNELQREIFGLVAIGVKHFVGPALDKFLPEKLTKCFKIGGEMKEKLSGKQIFFNSVRNELSNDEQLSKLMGAGNDIFNMYNNLKNGKFKINDITNTTSHFIEDDDIKQRVRSGGNLINTVVDGKYKNTKDVLKLAQNTSNTFLSGELKDGVNNWLGTANDFAEGNYVRGTASTLSNFGVKEAKYIKLIDIFKDKPSIQNALEMITEMLCDHINSINNLKPLINDIIKSRSFDNICMNIKQILNLIGSGNQTLIIFSEFIELIRCIKKLKSDTSISNTTKIINIIVSLIKTITGNNNGRMSNFEYVLKLYELAQQLIKSKSQQNAINVLQLVSNHHIKDNKIRSFINITCSAFNIRTMSESFNILKNCYDIIFDDNCPEIQSMLILTENMMNNNLKSINLNQTIVIIECILSSVSPNISFECITQIIRMEHNIKSLSLPSTIRAIDSLLSFYTKHDTTRSTLFKQINYVKNIIDNIIGLINDIKDKKNVSVQSFIGDLLQISILFGSQLENEFRDILNVSLNKIEDNIINKEQCLHKVIKLIENSHGWSNALKNVLKNINDCCNNFKWNKIFSVILSFNNMNNTSSAQIIKKITISIQSSLNTIFNVKEMLQYKTCISFHNICNLICDLLTLHPCVHKTGITPRKFINNVQNLMEKVKSIKNTKNFNISFIVKLMLSINNIIDSIYKSNHGLNSLLQKLINVINKIQNIIKRPSIKEIIECIQSISSVSLFDSISFDNSSMNNFDDLYHLEVPSININKNNVCSDLKQFSNALSNNNTFCNGVKNIKTIQQKQKQLTEFTKNSVKFNKIITSNVSKLINNELQKDMEFKYLFAFYTKRKNDCLSKLFETLNLKSIIRKSTIIKLIQQNILQCKCNVNKMIAFLNYDKSFNNCLMIITKNCINEYKKTLKEMHDYTEYEDKKRKLLKQNVTEWTAGFFENFNKNEALSGWEYDTDNLKIIEDFFIDENGSSITSYDISQLKYTHGTSGYQYVNALKECIINKKVEKLLKEEKQEVLNTNIIYKDYEGISVLLACDVSKILNVVTDDVLKNQINGVNTDWIDGYSETTNNFMDALQSYYHKKITNQRH